MKIFGLEQQNYFDAKALCVQIGCFFYLNSWWEPAEKSWMLFCRETLNFFVDGANSQWGTRPTFTLPFKY